MSWFSIHNVEDIDSPSLVLYKDRVEENLDAMIEMVGGDTSRLMPHVKTHKMPEMIRLQLDRGIGRFKTSTLAEAEMVADAGAGYVLLAHQLVGPKRKRFTKLIDQYPNTGFATICDNPETVRLLSSTAKDNELKIDCYIDINSGMNRSGIRPGNGLQELITAIDEDPHLILKGLHVYDGHIRDRDFDHRSNRINDEVAETVNIFQNLHRSRPEIEMITGGTPSFTTHARETERICSPGTCVFWDWGYDSKLGEQPFQFAVLLITRVISKPAPGIVTIDMGHKSVSAENPIDKRIKFLNISDYTLLSQSEEHGVLELKDWDQVGIGEVLYGVPYHICPTVNLYDSITLIEDHQILETWEVPARKRKLSI